MPKRLEITPKISGYLKRYEIDESTVAVFEATALNTLPVRKSNLFEDATHTESCLKGMVDYLSDTKNHVPIHTVHDQRMGELPIGKTIHAELLRTESNLPMVQTLYTIGLKEPVLPKIESGAIEEMSVGVSYKHMLCSQCGWDFMSEETTMDHIWSRTCGNGHEIGVDGVHLNLTELDRWLEMSVVSLGAANGAKILGRSKSLLGAERYNMLAASGVNPDSRLLFASATTPEPDMDLTKLIQELTDIKALHKLATDELTATKTELSGVKEKLTKAEADLTAANTKITTLEAGDLNKVKTDLEAAQKDAKEALGSLLAEHNRLAVIAGKPVKDEKATVAELTTGCNELRTGLSSQFGHTQRREVVLQQDDGVASVFSTKRNK